MIKVKRIGHATFETPDLARQIDYYCDVIGLRLVDRTPSRACFATAAGQLSIVLRQGAQARCAGLSFEVAPETDFARLRHRLQAADIASERHRDAVPGIPEMLVFNDFKDTAIELFSDWNFVDGDAPGSAGGPIKFGHLAFIVPDPKTAAEFYEETLGFRVSDWIEDWFVFLRCGSDHHTVNFVRGAVTRIHHIAFEMRDSAQLLQCCDVLGRHRIPILWGPVRHGPGHNVAAYHRDPDGHLVEFFIDLDEMVDEELGYFEPRPWHRDRPQKPKVWIGQPRDIWGLPPLPEFLRDTR